MLCTVPPNRRLKKAASQNPRSLRVVVQIKKSENSGANLRTSTTLQFSSRRDTMATYSCNICNQSFMNKNVRDTHRKNSCISSVTMRKRNGEEETIEKVNGKFDCICGRSFSRTDHFSSHWRECQTQGKIHLKNDILFPYRNNIKEKDLRANFDGRRVL
jgi:hypothetical protein